MAATKTNILTTSQINDIKKTIASLYATQVDNSLKLDLQKYLSRVNAILKVLETTTEAVYHTSEKFKRDDGSYKQKGIEIVKKQALSQRYLAEGYLLIFKFREFLLETPINYRYYFTDSTGTTHSREFSEENILKYIKFGQIAIEINASALQKNNKSNTRLISKTHDFLMNKYYKIFTQGGYMRQAKSSSRMFVGNPTFSKYVGQNPGLINQRQPDSRQLFTQGHIYEAIDTAISGLLQLKEATFDARGVELPGSTERQLLTSYVFGRYLAYDNIIASKGADNRISNTSIKSNDADLYDYRTIIKQLISIKKICEGNTLTPAKMRGEISKLFLDKNDFVSKQEMQAAASKLADKVLSEFSPGIKRK